MSLFLQNTVVSCLSTASPYALAPAWPTLVVDNNRTTYGAIPAQEAWLHKNAAALASVRRGLRQAAENHVVTGPDFAADAKLAGQLQGE
jgi:hypothetical protein